MKAPIIHPDLEDCLDGGVVNHPLLRVDLYHSVEDVNRMYEDKLMVLDNALENGDWETFVFLHERPYRLHALLELIDEHGVALSELWSTVGQTWCDSENAHQYPDECRKIWSLDDPDRVLAMDDEERELLAGLPDHLTIWRGIGPEKVVQSLSWSLDREKAVWFAVRFASDENTSLLASGRARKRDVRAYFTRRNESEILVFPEMVRDIQTVRIDSAQVHALRNKEPKALRALFAEMHE